MRQVTAAEANKLETGVQESWNPNQGNRDNSCWGCEKLRATLKDEHQNRTEAVSGQYERKARTTNKANHKGARLWQKKGKMCK